MLVQLSHEWYLNYLGSCSEWVLLGMWGVRNIMSMWLGRLLLEFLILLCGVFDNCCLGCVYLILFLLGRSVAYLWINHKIFVTSFGLLCYNAIISTNHQLIHCIESYMHSTLFLPLRTTITRVGKVLGRVGTLWALVILDPWAFGKSHAIRTWTHSPHQKAHPCLSLCTSHHTISVVHHKLLLICEQTRTRWLINPFQRETRNVL